MVTLLVLLAWIALSGLVVGALARLGLAGPDPMTIGQTILIGIAGTVIGSLLVYLILGRSAGGSFLASVACATFLVYLVRRRRERQGLRPPPPR